MRAYSFLTCKLADSLDRSFTLTLSLKRYESRDFGLWGLRRSPAEFTRALAALGAFQGAVERWPAKLDVETVSRVLSRAGKSNGLLRWTLSLVPPAGLDKLKPRSTARLFAEAWEMLPVLAKVRCGRVQREKKRRYFGEPELWILH